MRTIKQILVILLVLLGAAQIATSIYQGSSVANEPPVIACPEGTLDISASDDESVLLADVTASDPQDGDLTGQVIIGSISKLISNDTAKVTYLVFDSDDNMASHTRYIRYTDYKRPRFFVKEPLVFPTTESVYLLERMGATDVLDGNISDQIRVSTMAPTDNSEIFLVTVQVSNSVGDTAWQELPVLVQATDPLRPVINLTSYLTYLKKDAKLYPEDYLSSVTVAEQLIAAKDVRIDNQVDTSVPGTYHVYYTYDNNGHVGTSIMTVVVQ